MSHFKVFSPRHPTLSTTLGATIVALLLSASPLVLAEKKDKDPQTWSAWQSTHSGYLARRREPGDIEQPSDEQLAVTVAAHENTAAKTGFDTHALWFYTGDEAIYSVPLSTVANTLDNLERPRHQAVKGRFVLTNKGRPIAWHFDTATDTFLFAGEPYTTFHTDLNAYQFSQGRAKQGARPMDVVTGYPSSSGSPMPFADTLVFEEEPPFQFVTYVVAADQDADYWFWRAIWAGYTGWDSTELNLRIPAPAPSSAGGAQLRVTLRGGTNLESNIEHHVFAELNGQPVGEVHFDGFEEKVLVASDVQAYLDPAGNNVLRLYNTSDGSHPIQYVDKVEIDYTRMPEAESGKLWLHEVAGGTQTVSGFTSDDILVIEAPAGAGRLRQDITVEPDAIGGWTVTFDSTAGLDYMVSQRDAVAVASVLQDNPSDLNKSGNMADYLIIAHRSFSGTAQALARHRRNRYSYVQVVWLDDIYDEFAFGREDPTAITAFMESVQETWDMVPSVVTIIGKGSLDHKNRMLYGDSFVPLRMASTPWGVAASDDRLLASENYSGFAIGRLPITNDAEGMAYINKIETYEGSDYDSAYGASRYRAVLVADNPDDAGQFHDNSIQLKTQLLDTGGFSLVTELYHPRDPVRTNLIQSATWESGYVSYDGHGSATQVGDGNENFINANDAQLLQNNAYPVFTALTCAAGDDSLPGTRSLAAALVLNPTGGAIASMAPTGLSLDKDAQRLGAAFVDSLFNGMNTIGRAVHDAKVDTAGSVNEFMPRIYSVVGEPAIFAR